MAEAVPNTQHDFWRPPVIVEHTSPAIQVGPALAAAEVCTGCSAEFMVGAAFCHACGHARQDSLPPTTQSWTHYLEFHNIKQGLILARKTLGLPLLSLIAFLLGMFCLLGALSVGLMYSIQNFADFQAVQMWRMEWLLGAVAMFVAGILLKRPSSQK